MNGIRSTHEGMIQEDHLLQHWFVHNFPPQLVKNNKAPTEAFCPKKNKKKNSGGSSDPPTQQKKWQDPSMNQNHAMKNQIKYFVC